MRQRQNYSRAERKLQIVGVFQENIQSGLGNRLTMYEVAARLKMTPQTRLLRLMQEMETEKTLTSVAENKGNHWRYVFSLVHVEKQSRNIRINGIQLELSL